MATKKIQTTVYRPRTRSMQSMFVMGPIQGPSPASASHLTGKKTSGPRTRVGGTIGGMPAPHTSVDVQAAATGRGRRVTCYRDFVSARRVAIGPYGANMSESAADEQRELRTVLEKEINYLGEEMPELKGLEEIIQRDGEWRRGTGLSLRAVNEIVSGLSLWVLNADEMIKKHADFEKDVKTEFVSIIGQLEAVTAERDEIKLDYTALEDQSKTMANEIESLERMVDSLTNEINEQKMAMQVTSQQSNDVSSLENALAQASQYAVTLEDQVNEVTNEYEYIKGDYELAVQQNRQKDEMIMELEKQIHVLTESLEETEQKERDTKVSMAQSYAEFEKQIQEQKAELQAQVQEMQMVMDCERVPDKPRIMIHRSVENDHGAAANGHGHPDGDGETLDEMIQYEFNDEWLDDMDSESPPPIEIEPGYESVEMAIHQDDERRVLTPLTVDKSVEFETESSSIFQEPVHKRCQSLVLEMSTTQTANETTKSQICSVENEFVSESVAMHRDEEKKEEKPPMEFAFEKSSVTDFNDEPKEFHSDRTIMALDPVPEPEPMQFESSSMSMAMEQAPREKEIVEIVKEVEVIREVEKEVRVEVPVEKEVIVEVERHVPVIVSPLAKKMSFETQKLKMSRRQIEPEKPTGKQFIVLRGVPGDPSQRKSWHKSYTGGIDRSGTAFSKLLGQWKTTEAVKGGKPTVSKEARAYAMQNRWRRESRATLEGQRKSIKTVKATPATQSIVSAKSIKPVQKKLHTLKPRWYGDLKIVKSSLVPQSILAKGDNFFFCLDALPRNTNCITTESDDLKRKRAREPLVPSLFFFPNKQAYQQLIREVGALSTRDLKFQRAFAMYARGIMQLHERGVAKTQIQAKDILRRHLKISSVAIPKHLLDRGKERAERAFHVVGLKGEATMLVAPNTLTRDKWIARIQTLIRAI